MKETTPLQTMAHHHVPHHDVESGFGLRITMTTRRNETWWNK